MNENLEKFFELSLMKRALIIFLIPVLLIFLAWFLFFKDISMELVELENELTGMKNEINQRKILVTKFDKFQQEVVALEARLDKALEELPDKKEISRLLERVADKAKEAGLDIKLFEPQSEKINNYYAEIPVQIEVAGGYHQIAEFFDEITRLNRIINISDFSLSSPTLGEKYMIMKSAFIASAYRFLDESERPKEVKAKGKKSKSNKINE